MNKNDILQLFQSRSNGAVIRDGYKLYLGNFKTLLCRSWLSALIYAITVGLLIRTAIEQLPILATLGITGQVSISQMAEIAIENLIIVSVASLIFTVGAGILASAGFSALSEHQISGTISMPKKWYRQFDGRMLLRTAKLVVWMIIVDIIMSTILSGIAYIGLMALSPIASILLLIVAYITILAFLLPLEVIVIRYMLSEKSEHFVSTLTKYYAIGMRHWGGLFVVGFIMSIVVVILTIATEFPAFILFIANVQSQLGALQGDPLGMPSYMGWLNIIVFVIAGFIQAYVHLSFLFPMYYLYGSIITQEKEKSELKKQFSIHKD